MKKRPVITVLGLCGRSVFLNVDHFHAPGETVHADGIHVEPGGKGYNQAVAAARLGAKVNFITCCGDDEDGRACADFLEKESITACVELCRDRATAFASILTDSRGENQVTVYRGAADSMSGDFVRRHEQLIEESDVLLLNFEYPMEANLAALETAGKYSVPAILNPAPMSPVSLEFLRRFALTTPNFSEALSYPGLRGNETPEELAGYLVASGLPRAAVTLGSEGVLVVDGGEAAVYPAIRCEAKDTTGAGDTFNGALAVALAEGKSLGEAAVFAQNAASLSVRKHFVMPSLPTRAELEAQYTEISPIRLAT